MEGFLNVDLGEKPGVLEFSGPDAVRFLNGQITQDVRKVVGSGLVLPSCVTDAKGRLQFRIWITEGDSEAVLVFCRPEMTKDLEVRLTRYLIADDVKVKERSGEISMKDFGAAEIQERERIEKGIPKWGAELTEGMLPPEAGLDHTDISYSKGCYIGQEVISRIKSAGKVNRQLVKLSADGIGELKDAEGKVCGEVTSACEGVALAYVKRAAEGRELFLEGNRVDVL